MKLQRTKLGFTLIELLVVITIIGILATGAVSVFTSQIQKARDTTRISSVKALQSAVEQAYQDNYTYPSATTFADEVGTYIDKFPSDPKNGQPCADWTICAYIYAVTSDDNWILLGEYEISTWFENKGNVDSKAAKDKWDDDLRLEVWIDVWDSTWNTKTTSKAITSLEPAAWCTVIADWATSPGNSTDAIYIGDECS